MTVVNMELLILNFWFSFANQIRDGMTKKPTIIEHCVLSLPFYTRLINVCSMFQDGQKHCSHCVRVMNGSLIRMQRESHNVSHQIIGAQWCI